MNLRDLARQEAGRIADAKPCVGCGLVPAPSRIAGDGPDGPLCFDCYDKAKEAEAEYMEQLMDPAAICHDCAVKGFVVISEGQPAFIRRAK